MVSRRRTPRKSRPENAATGGYALVVRGPDGRPRIERFSDASAYKARLMALQPADAQDVPGLSIDEIAGLLDALN